MVIEKTMLLKIEEMTDYAYDVQKIKGEKDMYLITNEDVIGMFENLFAEIDSWKQKYEELKQDMQDNYQPIPMKELI